MNSHEAQIKILAAAIYEARLALTHLINFNSREKSPEVAIANLMYALHNDALAIIENNPDKFNVKEAVERIRKVEKQIDGSFSNFLQGVINEIET